MHKTRIAKRFFAMVLAQTLAWSTILGGLVPGSHVFAAEKTESEKTDSEEEVNKDETVYVITDGDGGIDEIIVSDKLKNDKGASEIFDASDLKDIENLKGEESYEEGTGNSIRWNAQGNDISYQGKSDKELPVDVKISYTLDGKPISAKNLAGKSGKVTIRFDYINKEKRKVNVKGKEYDVYVPFTIVSGAILDGEKFSNVQVENGKAIREGDKTIVFGYAMPGLKDSLGIGKEVLADQDDDIDVPDYVEMSADVQDFELDLTVTAVTNDLLNSLSTDDIDTKDVKDSIDELDDATNELVDGTKELQEGMSTAYDGSKKLATNMTTLATGAKTLEVAIGKYTNGVDQLYQKVPTLTSGVSVLNTGASKLAAGATDLKTGTHSYVAGVDTLVEGLLGDGSKKNPGYLNGVEQLEDGAKQLSGLAGLGQVYDAIVLMKAATSTDETYTDDKGHSGPTLGYASGAVTKGMQDIIDNVEALNAGVSGQNLKKIAGALNNANGLVASTEGKVQKVDEAAGQAKDTIKDAAKEAETQAANVEEAKEQLKDEKEALDQEISKKNEKIGEKNSAIENAQKKANEEINDSINSSISELKEAKSDLQSSKEALKEAKQALKDAETEDVKFDGKISKIEDKINGIDGKISKIDSAINSLEGKKSPVDVTENAVSAFEKTETSVDTSKISADALKQYGETLEQNSITSIDFTQEKAGMKQIADAISGAAQSMGTDPLAELIDAMKHVKEGSQGVTAGIASLHSNLSVLAQQTASFPEAAEGILALNKGFHKLTENNGTIRTGAKLLSQNGPVLKAGVKEIAEGSKTLAEGTDTLNTGAKTLSTGVKTLASNNKELNKGAKTLASGAKLLDEGSGTLSDGMKKLLEGTDTLKDGMKEYQEEGIQEIVDLYNNDILGLEDRFDAIREAGKAYQTYSKLAEGQKGSVKFIYKSDEIKKEEE